MTLPYPAGCVLIVEDETAFRDALAMAIGDEGYHVLCASNGSEAMLLLEHVRPDVIILDVNMPIMNGPAFLTEYRSRYANIAPIIVCSTRHQESLLSRHGISAYLSKPVDIEELLDTVRHYASAAKPSGTEPLGPPLTDSFVETRRTHPASMDSKSRMTGQASPRI